VVRLGRRSGAILSARTGSCGLLATGLPRGAAKWPENRCATGNYPRGTVCLAYRVEKIGFAADMLSFAERQRESSRWP
jgi:hypothetical protein